MNIGYYKKWVEEFTQTNISTQTVSTFEDMLMISFKETSQILHLHYGNSDIMPFWGAEAYSHLSKPSIFANYLQHTTLTGCQLLGDDKILLIFFAKLNIYNQKEDLTLIFEMIPRYQNIILCKTANDKHTILECLKKITFADQHTRQILPGAVYQPPVTSYVHTSEDISLPITINEYFVNKYSLIYQNKIETLKNQIIKSFEKDLKKAQNKLQKQLSEMDSANELQHWQHCVELLKSSFHLLKPGMERVVVTDYFAQSGGEGDTFPEIEIKLNPALSAQKNLDFYVKKYRKAVSGQTIIAENIKKTEKEIAHIREQLSAMAEYDDYTQCRDAINGVRSILGVRSSNNNKRLFRILPISAEWEILIGRSSKENDLLTCKTAKPDDWWFHSRIFHGTHVVLRNFLRKTPPDELIVLCSSLAAYYSSAKNSTNVPVDYTQIRYVTKPRGAVPGYVIYKNQKTYYANPMSIREAGAFVGAGFQPARKPPE